MNIRSKTFLLALTPVMGLLSVSNQAVAEYVHGAICQPINASITGYSYTLAGLQNDNQSSRITVVCPSPTHINIGSSAQWQVRVEDKNTSSGQDFWCQGAALKSNGDTIGFTSNFSQSGSGVEKTLSFSFGMGSSSSSYSYAAYCQMPKNAGGLGKSSLIENIRTH